MSLVRLAAILAIGASAILSLPVLGAQNNAVVPNANASTEGTGTQSAIFLQGTDSVVQLFVDSTQLTNFASGDQINGMSVRLDDAETTNGAISYTQFDIEFSDADTNSNNQGLLASTTFATNQGSTPVMVRSGSLSIGAGAITDGASPNAFSFVIPFTTPYTYSAGSDIVITIHMSGLSGSATILDTVPTNQAHLIDWQGNDTSASATVSNSTIIAAPVIELISEPEMDVSFATNPVASGSTIALGSFGNEGSAYTHTIDIENNGVETLTISTPVAAPGSLTNCTAMITSQPSASLAPGGATTLDVWIKPSGTGLYSCTISITNNDRDENPYVFTIEGTAGGPAPEFDLYRFTAGIANGATDSIGDVDYGVSHTLIYRIENNGLATLNLTTTPLITITTGINIKSVTITTLPDSTITAGAFTTFEITYVTLDAGAWALTVSVGSDDADENPYTWTISGTSTFQGSSGGGDDEEDSCSTTEGGGISWMLLLGMLALATVTIRVARRERA
ncbi:MAG: choice-of-anchor D domain-containing protein [Planctomycetes bacterium]|nr:choice-of-anchor D domain-containing protein [Planctomycetota bacterium]